MFKSAQISSWQHYSRVLDSGGKGFSEVKTRSLGIPFGHKSCLESLHRPINIPLDLELPLGTYNLLARGKLDYLPSSIPLEGLKFFNACLLPLARLRALLGCFEGLGLSDRGEVGIGSGVEGVISSGIIVLKDMMGEKRQGVLMGSILLYTTMKIPTVT